MNVETRHIKYAFADVVDFTLDRTVDAQVEIVAELNLAFQKASQGLETIFLPTGDGICAGIIEPNAPADAHLRLALSILEHFHHWNEAVPTNRKCKIRFGINEDVDSIVIDINGQRNIAGAGINQTQRIMGIAGGNQIIVGERAHKTLSVRDAYENAFREVTTEIKHGYVVTAYQYIQGHFPYLDIETPSAVTQHDPIDLRLTTALSNPENFATWGMVDCVSKATEEWEEQMNNVLRELTNELPAEVGATLVKTQKVWEKYRSEEDNMLNKLRAVVRGSMFRITSAYIRHEAVKQRVHRLRNYRDEWLPSIEDNNDQ